MTTENGSGKNGNFSRHRETLNTYAGLGWKLVSAHKDKRHPHYKGWQETDFSLDLILSDMAQGHGVGVQTGEVSNWLAPVDLDSHYARVVAHHFLARTQEIAKERERDGLSSIWLYYSVGAPKVTVKPLNPEAEKGAVVELLGAPSGQGRQVIVPPSTHPKKGSYYWVEGFDPERIVTLEPEELEQRVRRLGASALIAEHLPASGLHDFSLALAGYLLRHGEDKDTVSHILISAWDARGLIEVDGGGLRQNVEDTAKSLETGDNITGGKTVNKTVPGLAEKLADALGWDEKDRPPTPEELQARAERAWELCRELAEKEDILSEVYAMQQRDGLVGEEVCAKIMQLVAVTRHKGQPMSAIVNGESSGGKSYLLKQTAKTLPDDALYVLQSVSDKALAYIGENTLTNKFLLIYELGGLGKEGESGIEMIKQLLTEGRIDRQIAEGTGKGVRGRRVYTEGPTGLWTTTTKNVVDAELQNRALTLAIDESPAQTERIIKSRKNRKKRAPVDFTPIKALHTWLSGQSGNVDIPFEDVIADGVDARAVRMRRFYDYIMELVEAHALLHRATREVDADGYVIAKPEDYAAVYGLVKDIVSEAAEVSVSFNQRQTVRAARTVLDAGPITADSLAKQLKISRSSASRRLGAATREGYLRHDPDAKGKTKVYVMGEIELPEETKTAIPTPEDTEEAMRAAYDEVCKCAKCAGGDTPPASDAVKSVVKCARGICTLDAHLDSDDPPKSKNPLPMGNLKRARTTKNRKPDPPMHTLHTCTDEENGSQKGSVHASVQGGLHTSEPEEEVSEDVAAPDLRDDEEEI